MILPDGCDCQFSLQISDNINSIVSNRDRTIVAIATDTSLHFYLAETKLLIYVLQRDEDDIKERGIFTKAYWKPDSTAICLMTINNFLNIYSVEVLQSTSSFTLQDPVGEAKAAYSRDSSELYIVGNKPQINVNLVVVARLEAEPTCVLSFKEELLLSLTDGWMHRLSWSGAVLQGFSFNIRSLIIAELKEKSHKHASDMHISDIAPFFGGICAVFNDGSGALLVSSTVDFKPDSINILWANGLLDACCCTTNFKFRLLYFGCKNGDIAAYSQDDLNGGLVHLFRIHLALKNGIEYLDRLSSVRQISSLATQGALAVIWNGKTHDRNDSEKLPDDKRVVPPVGCPPTLAIFSPFGEQWWCSLEDNSLDECLWAEHHSSIYTTLDWAVEGYQLWLGTSNAGIHMINLIKSIPNLHDKLAMLGADRVFLSPKGTNSQLAANNAPHLVWQIFKPPHSYLASNYPLKHVAFGGDSEKVLVVGGLYGFCVHHFRKAKWRMFRKEVQEKSLQVTGGFVVFKDFILCSACNLEANSDEADRFLVFYLDDQLDLDFAHFTLTNRILHIKLSGSSLIAFDVNSVIDVYSLAVQPVKEKGGMSGLEMECIAEIRIADFLPHPSCFVAVELAKLNFYSDSLPFCAQMDSLLVNVSGHLLLLSPMHPQSNGQEKSLPEGSISEFQLHPPTLVASFVEDFWIIHPESGGASTRDGPAIPYLSEALWINAGCRKSKIWLPLSLEMEAATKRQVSEAAKPQLKQQNSRTFISRRIMLPLGLNSCPLLVDDNYLACSVNSTSIQLKSAAGGRIMTDDLSLTSKFTEDDSLSEFVGLSPLEDCSPLSLHSLLRTCEVFIHKLLKELLKRNLGSYAFELASECRPLSYFPHILELLLHDLLDEEATSSEPIPDPLLPTIVSFLHEFPGEYLQTIVHCARKTELAFWNLLFSASNHPRQLFQMCLEEGQLDTATSCLIILHSLVSIRESSKLAFQLLEEALVKRRWSVAQDIVRFMQNIGRATERNSLDYGDSPESPIQAKLSHHSHPVSAFNSSNDEFSFPLFSSQVDIDSAGPAFVQQQRRRSGSGKMADLAQQKHGISAFGASRKQLKCSPNYSFPAPSNPAPSSAPKKGGSLAQGSPPPALTLKMQSAEKDGHPQQGEGHNFAELEDILTKHASNLLEDFALRDLGAFSSYLPFDFVAFFRHPDRTFGLEAEQFPLVLMKLHAQFTWPWPYPLAGPPSVSNAGPADPLILLEKGAEGPKAEEQADAELSYVFSQLLKAEAFEWLFLLCILRRDIRLFNEQVLAPMRELEDRGKRFEAFLRNIRLGTNELLLWAQTKCPAYLPVVRLFADFVECGK